MHDPKFEKEVQQKMAELEFSPSESVWANIEKAVNKRRERRFLPFFFRFALPALLLVAGGGYLLLREGPTPANPETAKTSATKPAIAAPAEATPTATIPATKAAPAVANPTPAATNPAPTAITPASGTPSVTSPAATMSTASAAPASGHAISSHAVPAPITSTDRNNLAVSNKINDKTTSKHSRNKDHKNIVASTLNDPAVPTPLYDPAEMQTSAGQAAIQQQRTPADFNPSLATLDKSKRSIFASELKAKTTTTITPQKPKRPWEAAFVGGAGISALHQMQISNYSIANDLPASNFTANASVTQTVANPSKQYVSTVDPGFSFWAGVQARKQLSKKWAFNAGLGLHYYSTRVKLGYQVTSYNAAASPYFQSTFAPIQNYPYYSTGDLTTYTNKYYFLELPIGIEYQLNNSRLLPIFLNGGVNVSYLMGSSAVYYNTHSGVYFKDGGVANHTQFNLAGGLMVGLPIKSLRVQVGPQIQYGLTPLLNTSQSGEQHIFYTGLRLVVFPGKK